MRDFRGSCAYFFLAKVKQINRSKFKNLHKNFNAPIDSKVVMTSNAYMTDEAWLEIVPNLCASIRNLDVIRDVWWLYISNRSL